MPNEYSNFTNPDVGSTGNGAQGNVPDNRPAGSTDSSKRWDPTAINPMTGQPTGAWVPATPTNTQTAGNASQNTITKSAGAWGGTADMKDAGGVAIEGTSGMAIDRDRYRGMGQKPTNPNGPQIDQSVSGESRGLSMGALGLLRNTAEGTGPSAAQQLQTKQGQDAANAQFGIAASVRGGAAARAAAARNAASNASTIGQQTLAANRALRAGEMANARGDLLDASGKQRGLDLGAATEQAKLEAGQRGLNDNHEAFYEGLAQDTQQANLNHQLGRSEADSAAAQAALNNNVARDEASRAATMNAVRTGLGGVTGGVQAMQRVNGEEEKSSNGGGSGWDDPDTTSSEKAKDNIEPVTSRSVKSRVKGRSLVDDVKAAQLMNQANTMISSQEAGKAAPAAVAGAKGYEAPSVVMTPGAESAARGEAEIAEPVRPGQRIKKRTQDEVINDEWYDGSRPHDERPIATWGTGEKAGGSNELHEAMRQAVERDAGPPDKPLTPVNPYPEHRSLFGDAPPGYAAFRADQQGGMFGNPHGRKTGGAPGTEDFYAAHIGDPHDNYSRAIMGLPKESKFGKPDKVDVTMSDANAKRQAFLDGVNHAQKMQDTGVNPPDPDYMGGPRTPHVPQDAGVRQLSIHDPHTAPKKASDAAKEQEYVTRAHPLPDNTDGAGNQAVIQGAAVDTTPRGKATPKQIAAIRMKERADALAAAAMGAPDNGAITYSDENTKFGVKMPSAQDPVFLKPEDAVRYSNDRDAKARADAKKHDSDQEQARESKRWAGTTFSDERAKSEDRFGGPMAQANRSMEPKVYEYKPGFAEAEGQKVGDKNVGPIAQKMEADPVASTVIVHDPETGMMGIDKSKGLKLVMGGLASVQKEVDELKGKKKRA